MDTKALAKSKRAHSLHHSKKHQTQQARKVPSSTKTPTGKQDRQKPPQSHPSKPLPSNWELYDRDLDLGLEEAQASSSLPTEFVVPRSKGSDYAHLISEAKAQSHLNYSHDGGPLFDDFIYDFTQDFGPLLASKGRSIHSWIEDDNFEFDSKASTSFEAPVLSLNLNVLAEQLAKAKLSERLVLEPDLLPRELLDEELQACDKGRHDLQTCTSAAEKDSRATSLSYNMVSSRSVQQYDETSSSAIYMAGNSPVHTADEGLKPIKQNKDEILELEETDRNISPESTWQPRVDSTAPKPPIFEVATAEAELDMSLSSFSESTILEPSGASTVGIPSISVVSGETVSKGMHITKPASIDDLLEETSTLTKIESRWLSNGATVSPGADMSSTTLPSSKSELVDDFDSWLDTI